MTTLDAHQHFWHYRPERDTWIDGSMAAIRRDFLPEDLAPLLQNHQVDGCIAVQASQSVEETEFLLNLADTHPFIRGVVGWVDLRSAGLSNQLDRFAGHPAFVGVRHVVQAEPPGFLLDKRFQRGIGLLSEYGLTYDLLVLTHQLEEAAELVRRFPGQAFVLDHLAKPAVSHAVRAPWASGMRALAGFPNVSCKLSGLVTEATDWNWERDDFAPFIQPVLECFGSDRLFFGSDWPVCTLAASYREVKELTEYHLRELPAEARAAVMGGNALRFYGLS